MERFIKYDGYMGDKVDFICTSLDLFGAAIMILYCKIEQENVN